MNKFEHVQGDPSMVAAALGRGVFDAEGRGPGGPHTICDSTTGLGGVS